jgi:hypothetical protein
MRRLKLYATSAGTGNAIANVVIPSAGRLRGIQWSVWADSITDNAGVDLEISLASATEIAVNGSQQCVSQVGVRQNFVTSGLSAISITPFHPVDIPVVQGQIIYLHSVVVGTITFNCTAIIHYA